MRTSVLIAEGAMVSSSAADENAGRPSRLQVDVLVQLPAAVAYLTGSQHTFEFANPAFLRLVGGREVMGRPVREALPELAGQGYFETLDKVFATGEPAEGREADVSVRGASGNPETVYVDFALEPVRDQRGTVLGVLVHASDVTAHVLDRQALRQVAGQLADAEDRYRRIFETMLSGVVSHDADGVIMAVNPTAERILGASADELVGMAPPDPRWRSFRDDGTRLPLEEHPVNVALRTGAAVADVLIGVDHKTTGERRWLSVAAVPDAPDDHGRPQRIYTMFSDVTDERHAAAALQERDVFLRRLRDTNVLGIVVSNQEGVLEANDAFLEMVGYTRDDVSSGRLDWRAITSPGNRTRDDLALDELLRTGACRPFEKTYVHASGRLVPALIGSAVVDRDPLRWVTFVADLSERQRAERERAQLVASAHAARVEAQHADEQLGFLLSAGALAAATHDRDELLQLATRLVVPALADFAVVLLPGESGGLEASAVAHRDPSGAAVLARLRQDTFARDNEGALSDVFRSGTSQLLRDIRSLMARRTGRYPSLAGMAEELELDSVVAAALSVGAHRQGVLLLGRSVGRDPFSDVDLTVAEELGRRLATGLVNADDFTRERDVAEVLQRSLLPDALPDVPGVDLAVRYLPATEGVDVGGDWYDVFELGSGLRGLAVGDVVGHNLASASVMGQLRNGLRAYAVDDPDPADVLRRTNTAMTRLFPDMLATVFFAVLDVDSGELTYANAGHPPPVLTDPGGRPRFLSEGAGLLLGFVDDIRYEARHHALAPDETLLIYSDGLIEEGKRSLDEGLEALAEVCASHNWGSAGELCDAATANLLGSGPRADDVSLLAVRRLASPPTS
ncbi:MAG: SpoIIE family protein phosphatase [Nocardioidaceae bacterium]